MDIAAHRFSGYSAGDTDFAARVAAADAATQTEFFAMLGRLADLVTTAPPDRFMALTVVGYSDKQDRPDMSCDQRRQSEEDASTDRAAAAWEWIKTEVGRTPGVPPNDWWDESTNLTWALIGAGATRLAFPTPAGESDRAANRRLTVLVSEFPVIAHG